MTRSVLTWMLVVAVCLPPAIHLLSELGRLIGGANAVSEPPPPPNPEARAAATKKREAAEATARALLRGPARPDAAAKLETDAPVAKLLDVAGEFLGAMEVASGSAPSKPAVGDGLKGEDKLHKLVEDRKDEMKGLVAARNLFHVEYGYAELNKQVMRWVAACKGAEGFVADPKDALKKVEGATSAYDKLLEDWGEKKQTLDEETSELGRRWGEVRSAFEKLATKRGVDPLVAFAELHGSVDNDSDRETIRTAARKWLGKWLPEQELPLDPNVIVHDTLRVAKPLLRKRAELFVVYRDVSVGADIRYEARNGKFAEFARDPGGKAEMIDGKTKTIEFFSFTKTNHGYNGYTKVEPTEWSRAAHAYNLGRLRKGFWAGKHLTAWETECKPYQRVVMAWKTAAKDGADKPSGTDRDTIVLAYERASALFSCLHKCKVLFPDPPLAAKEK